MEKQFEDKFICYCIIVITSVIIILFIERRFNLKNQLYKQLFLSLIITLFIVSKIKIDIYVKTSFFIITFFIIFFIVDKINILKETGIKIENIIYLILVFLILIFPIKKIDNKEIDINENRTLAKKSQLFLENKINLNFGKEAEDWLSDHFYRRAFIIKENNKLDKIIKGRIENNLAFLGKDDWIFYKGDNSILNYQNINLFSNEELNQIKNTLISRKKYFDKKKTKYYTIVIPDKNKIYGDRYYPTYIKKINSIGRKQLQLYLKNLNNNVSIIYPYENLLRESRKNLIYWKNDTHWNSYGAYIGYLELMKEIKKDFPDIQEVKEKDLILSKDSHLKGDLSTFLFDVDKKMEKKYSNILYNNFSLKKRSFNYIKNDGKNGIITESNKKYKVLVFRDSFTISMVPYISQTFGKVNYVWSHNLNEYEDLINEYQPDIVIYESVERYIEELKNNFNLKEK